MKMLTTIAGGPRFNSQHPPVGSQSPVTPAPRVPAGLPSSQGHGPPAHENEGRRVNQQGFRWPMSRNGNDDTPESASGKQINFIWGE